MKTLKNKDTVTVIARRWFDKIYGNTYHSVKVYVNGDLIGSEDFDYGYEDHYQQCAMDILRKHYRNINKDDFMLWKLRDICNVVNSVTDVNRKKDL